MEDDHYLVTREQNPEKLIKTFSDINQLSRNIARKKSNKKDQIHIIFS